ncbi:hypothetical protein JOF29_004830 [Kribbella aluminosa]|uniref:Pyrroloquinoline-quinone binding quinoprotein n=1 Tax=Kribbella aluminosa TaxID=416017 RepID=A0ABS4UQ06_9ACTN|nr:hypothetical protein [Kribbella aluminosa]MBP2353720.1 hypothetical protein [Kribbella aluminosa]
MAEKIPSWPKVTIRLYDDHNAEVKIAGRSHPLNNSDPRAAAIQLVAERAAQLGRAVKVTAVEADGASWPLVIHPDGQVDAIDTDTRRNKKPVWPIFVAMAVAVVLIAGTALYITVFSKLGNHKPVVTASPKLPVLPGPSVGPDEFPPRTQPPGWSTHASWTVDMAPNSTPAIRPDGTEVAILTTDQKVAVFTSSGKLLWQDKVTKDSLSPVYTTIDSKLVLAVASPDTLSYWAGDGALPSKLPLPDSAKVTFFGKSPLILLGSDGGSMVVSGGKLTASPQGQRFSTPLLAEGDRTLYALPKGPLGWTQPGKDLVPLNPVPPKGVPAGNLQEVVTASSDYALVLWADPKQPGKVIPVVHSTASGKVVAVCGDASSTDPEHWAWVPDPNRKFAAWGECLINLTAGQTRTIKDFQPLSISGSFVYGTLATKLYAATAIGKLYPMPDGMTRPWAIAANHAILAYSSVLYALDPQK